MLFSEADGIFEDFITLLCVYCVFLMTQIGRQKLCNINKLSLFACIGKKTQKRENMLKRPNLCIIDIF